ncbi:hypothetical protein CFE70_003639 [Pyrenophora teres f. teres 0-1]
MSLAEANRQYFDKPWFTKVNTQVADFLRAELPWIGIPFVNTGSRADEATGEVRLLDYACGTGLMTRLQTATSSTNLTPLPGTLIPQYFNFDIATVGFGFHHFEDVVYAAGQLKQRLRPGGVLVINDFLEGGDVLVDEGEIWWRGVRECMLSIPTTMGMATTTAMATIMDTVTVTNMQMQTQTQKLLTTQTTRPQPYTRKCQPQS